MGRWAERAAARLRMRAWRLLLFGIRHSGAAFIKWGQWSATREDLFPQVRGSCACLVQLGMPLMVADGPLLPAGVGGRKDNSKAGTVMDCRHALAMPSLSMFCMQRRACFRAAQAMQVWAVPAWHLHVWCMPADRWRGVA